MSYSAVSPGSWVCEWSLGFKEGCGTLRTASPSELVCVGGAKLEFPKESAGHTSLKDVDYWLSRKALAKGLDEVLMLRLIFFSIVRVDVQGLAPSEPTGHARTRARTRSRSK